MINNSISVKAGWDFDTIAREDTPAWPRVKRGRVVAKSSGPVVKCSSGRVRKERGPHILDSRLMIEDWPKARNRGVEDSRGRGAGRGQFRIQKPETRMQKWRGNGERARDRVAELSKSEVREQKSECRSGEERDRGVEDSRSRVGEQSKSEVRGQKSECRGAGVRRSSDLRLTTDECCLHRTNAGSAVGRGGPRLRS
jgi:hypothetical protein